MKSVIENRECTGCSACANACPKTCIKMQPDNAGFLFPNIEEEKCINCNICKFVCPVLHFMPNSETDFKEAWGVTINDNDILLKSSSGGLFSAIAQHVLNMGGCVFGAAFSEDYKNVNHVVIENRNDLCRIRGSKYVQSASGDCYRTAKALLNDGRKVLYSGTPCQIAGLRAFLGKKYDHLITVDVICHGVPSGLLWRKYLNNIEEEMQGATKSVNFRSKKVDWIHYGMQIMNNKTYYKSKDDDPYLKMFLNNCCLRESCYHCKFKGNKTNSDITIGDFWGVRTTTNDIDGTYGVSLAIIHTKEGRAVFEEVKSNCKCVNVDYNKSIVWNKNFINSVTRPGDRDSFYNDLQSMEWNAFEYKYTQMSVINKIRKMLSKSLIGAAKRKLLNGG